MFPRASFLVLFGALALVVPSTLRSQSAVGGAPNEGALLAPDPATSGAYVFSWWGLSGRTYFLQQSDDLHAWTYLPVIEPGAGQPIAWGFTSSAPRFFLRLRLSDVPANDPFAADFDDDHVANWDELLQGSDPLSAALDPANGLPLDWEQFYHVPAGTDPDSLAPRGDGLTYRQSFEGRLNPNDLFSGWTPVLAVVSGDGQSAPPASLLPAALVVRVTDTGGLPLAHAPVTFTVTGAGGGLLKASSSAPLVTMLTLRADEAGEARAYFRLPDAPDQACQITAASGPTSQPLLVTFTATSTDSSAPPVISPFAPTNFLSQGNLDGSLDMSWENHTDNQTPIEISFQRADGSWRVVATLPPGTTHYHWSPPR